MAARGCLGRPWFFREANHLLRTGQAMPPPSPAQVKQIMLRHYKLLKEHAGESRRSWHLRRHLPYYARAMGRESDFATPSATSAPPASSRRRCGSTSDGSDQ